MDLSKPILEPELREGLTVIVEILWTLVRGYSFWALAQTGDSQPRVLRDCSRAALLFVPEYDEQLH